MTLLDNAQGSSNVNAKGAHRLKVTLTLAKLPIGSAEDEDFIELLRVKNGRVQEKTRNTEYSVLVIPSQEEHMTDLVITLFVLLVLIFVNH